MRCVVASLLVIGSFAAPAAAEQGSGAAGGKSGKGACALLTRDLVEKVLGDAANKTLLGVPPTEEGIGASGSACHYGGITLQIDFMTTQQFEEMRKKDGRGWETVPGVGDSAYFRNNQNRFAEVLGRTGTRTFSVLMGFKNSSIDQVKPRVIAAATAIVPRMR